MNSVKKIAILTIVALVAITPFALSASESDAAGEWWGSGYTISIEAGNSLDFPDLEAPSGDPIQKVTVTGDAGQWFTVNDDDLHAFVPADTAAGKYTAKISASTTFNTYTMTLVLDVKANSNTNPGYASYAPVIDGIDIKPLGNSYKTAVISVDMKNVKTMWFDFNDGVITDNIDVSTDSISTAHKYSQDGLYAVNVHVSNEYGSAEKVVVYNAGNGTVMYGELAKETSTMDWIIIIAAAAALIISLIGFMMTRNPYVLIVTIIAAIYLLGRFVFGWF